MIWIAQLSRTPARNPP